MPDAQDANPPAAENTQPAAPLKSKRRPKISNGGYPPWLMAVLIRCKAQDVCRMYHVEKISQHHIAKILGVGDPTVKRMLDWISQFETTIAVGDYESFERVLFEKYPRYKDEDFYKEYVVDCKWPIDKKRKRTSEVRSRRHGVGQSPNAETLAAEAMPVAKITPEAQIPNSNPPAIPPSVPTQAIPLPSAVAMPRVAPRAAKRTESDEMSAFVHKKP